MMTRIMKEIYTKFTCIAGTKIVLADIVTKHCGIWTLVPITDLSHVMEIVTMFPSPSRAVS